MQKARCSCQI